MIERKFEIAMADGIADAILYAPGDGQYQGLLFYTDIFGVRPANQGMVRRIAEQGYAVTMPNIFYRYGKPPFADANFKWGEPDSMKIVHGLFAALNGAMMEKDAPVYVEAQLQQQEVSGPKLGVVGYCFSGAMSLRTAAVVPDEVAAAASFHGGHLVTEAPDSPHSRVPRVKGELYFGHAVEDQSMPPDAIEKLNYTLKAWGGRYESEVYEGALHGWTVPGRDVYNEKQAERAHAKLLDLLKRNL
ncbi:MAG TPA: dienelactone hydrolase family protein [Rhizomicrobium sp.]|nr:dienelactone hydrolase family protein [Rhizomicrobium sp.]